MFSGCLAIYADVIVNCYDASEAISNLVHPHLVDVLGHLESKLM